MGLPVVLPPVKPMSLKETYRLWEQWVAVTQAQLGPTGKAA